MIDTQLAHLDLHERSVQSKHQRLHEHLVNQIAMGRLKPGQKLPSEHFLVRTLGVARTTIRQAMASLENEGLIRRVQGKGTFVEAEVRRKLHHGQDIFALVVPETLEAFYPSLLHGFEAAAGDVHHQTIICNTGNDVGRQADVVLQLLDKEVGGVASADVCCRRAAQRDFRQFRFAGRGDLSAAAAVGPPLAGRRVAGRIWRRLREGALARRLTSVVVDEIGTGRRAVELLHQMRCGDRPIDDNEEIVLELTLSRGETLAPAASCNAIGVLS